MISQFIYHSPTNLSITNIVWQIVPFIQVIRLLKQIQIIHIQKNTVFNSKQHFKACMRLFYTRKFINYAVKLHLQRRITEFFSHFCQLLTQSLHQCTNLNCMAQIICSYKGTHPHSDQGTGSFQYSGALVLRLVYTLDKGTILIPLLLRLIVPILEFRIIGMIENILFFCVFSH